MQDQNVLLVGLGESGLACARWALGQGARLTVLDTRAEPPGLASLKEDGAQFELLHDVQQLAWPYDRVCVSPGLAPHHPMMQAVVSEVSRTGGKVESELDWFADALVSLKAQHQYQPRVVGITGTNGKTTTVSMVACMIRHSGASVLCAGNVSPSALHALAQALRENELPQFWVLELSSFQLHWTNRLRCDVAAVLNLTEDHLDWHQSMEAYAADKARIFLNADEWVLNRDDSRVISMKPSANAQIHTFGLGQPTQPGQTGLMRDGGLVWLAMTDLPPRQAAKRARKSVEPEQQTARLLMPVEALTVPGTHNASNALAALAMCRAIGLPVAGLLHGLRAYTGEPHRVQHVQTLDDVDYIDDSKGTNVGATVAALNGLERKVVLIAGGQGKGQSFEPLLDPVRRFCRRVIVFGQDAQELREVLSQVAPVEMVSSMQQAVEQAHQVAESGDCVLLSPACASFDMFESYADRGDSFVDAIQELATQRGQVC